MWVLVWCPERAERTSGEMLAMSFGAVGCVLARWRWCWRGILFGPGEQFSTWMGARHQEEAGDGILFSVTWLLAHHQQRWRTMGARRRGIEALWAPIQRGAACVRTCRSRCVAPIGLPAVRQCLIILQDVADRGRIDEDDFRYITGRDVELAARRAASSGATRPAPCSVHGEVGVDTCA